MTEPRFPRFLHEIVDEPPTGFPHKALSLAAYEQGTLILKTVLTTATGDRFHQTHPLYRGDALDLIAALSEWVASPDSALRESPDGSPAVNPFGPKDATEARVFAEECFRVDVQVALHEHMRSAGVSVPELAARMNVPAAQVSAFFADECNVTVRDLARFYHALGLPPPSLRSSRALR